MGGGNDQGMGSLAGATSRMAVEAELPLPLLPLLLWMLCPIRGPQILKGGGGALLPRFFYLHSTALFLSPPCRSRRTTGRHTSRWRRWR